MTRDPAVEAHVPTMASYGLLAEFESADAVVAAARAAHAAGYRKINAYTPFPVHGMDRAMGLKNSRVGWFAFLGGVTGYATGMLMIWWMNALDYPIVVGGKPMFSPHAAFPPSYELTILFGALMPAFGMLLLNGLPRLNYPVFGALRFHLASRDRFFLCIKSDDRHFEPRKTAHFLKGLGAQSVEAVPS